MLSADLVQKCRALALDALVEYKADHGGQAPRIGQTSAEIEGYFQADFRALRREGATGDDRAAARSEWEACFYALEPAT